MCTEPLSKCDGMEWSFHRIRLDIVCPFICCFLITVIADVAFPFNVFLLPCLPFDVPRLNTDTRKALFSCFLKFYVTFIFHKWPVISKGFIAFDIGYKYISQKLCHKNSYSYWKRPLFCNV